MVDNQPSEFNAKLNEYKSAISSFPVVKETAEKSELLAYAKQHGLENLCRLLYNLHEFVFVD